MRQSEPADRPATRLAYAVMIFGAGGHGRVCAEIATAQGFHVAGFIDEVTERPANGVQVIASSLDQVAADTSVFIAIGDNAARLRHGRQALARGFDVPVLVHPAATVSPSAEIGAGTVVHPGVIIAANARIGRFCILNTGCSVDHDSRLADGVQIAPGARLCGEVEVGPSAMIGPGAVVTRGVRIGDGATIGAGAIVLRDVAPGACVAGNPARDIGARREAS